MTRNLIYVPAVLTLLLSACKKDRCEPIHDPDTIFSTGYPDYGKLAVGNYWVYQTYEIDTNGVEIVKPFIDSCYVSGDTTVNGHRYFKVVQPYGFQNKTAVRFLRDSLHYIVELTGQRLFSSEDFTNELAHYVIVNSTGNDTIYSVSFYMTDRDSLVNTPAGAFVTMNYEGLYHAHLPGAFEFRLKQKRYAKDIGVVEENIGFFSSSTTHFARRLIAYHVN